MKIYKKWWKVDGASLKPSRTCAGMNETAQRSNHSLSDDARKLCVWGTLDKLARNSRAKTVYRYVLSDSGRARLRAMKGGAT